MERVFASEYFEAHLDPEAQVVKLVRTPLPFRALPDFVRQLEGILSSLPQKDWKRFRLLYDARKSPQPGGKAYMKAFSRMARELTDRFGAVVVIVRDVEMMETVQEYDLPKVHLFTNSEAAHKVITQLSGDTPK